MSGRMLVCCLLFVGLLLPVAAGLDGWARAGDPPKPPPDDPVMKAIGELSAKVDKLSAQVVTRKEVRDLRAEMNKKLDRLEVKQDSDVSKLGKRLDDLESATIRLRSDLTKNISSVNDHEAILRDIITEDSSNKRAIVAIEDMRSRSRDFRNQFDGAIRDEVKRTLQASVPQPGWGILRIENNMSTWQYIRVNGYGHWVAPFSALEASAPVGWSTTELVGYEGLKTWWIGSPGVIQRVRIDPQPAYPLFPTPVAWM